MSQRFNRLEAQFDVVVGAGMPELKRPSRLRAWAAASA
jgi:hypothetical protein